MTRPGFFYSDGGDNIVGPIEWVTRPWLVTLCDGTKKSTYAATEEQAIQQIQRHMDRHGVRLVAESAVPWETVA